MVAEVLVAVGVVSRPMVHHLVSEVKLAEVHGIHGLPMHIWGVRWAMVKDIPTTEGRLLDRKVLGLH